MSRLAYRGLVPAVVAVPACGALTAARENVIADVILLILATGIVLESLALLTNWRHGTDAVVSHYRKTPNSIVASLRGWSFRLMAAPLLLIGLLFFGASISYLAKAV